MNKKLIYLTIVLLIIIAVGVLTFDNTKIEYSIENNDESVIKNTLNSINKIIAYGHVEPGNRDFLLSFLNPHDTKKIVEINLGNLFTRNIFYDNNQSKIWVPAEYESNLKLISNKIKIIDINTQKVEEELEVGLSPVDIKFINNIAIVTCLEKGIRDVSVYLIDTNKYKIMDKILIGGDTFEFSEVNHVNDQVYIITEDVDNRISLISVIDVKSSSLKKQYKYPDIPLHGIQLVNNDLWVAGGNQILIINSETGELKRKVQTDMIAYQLESNESTVMLSHYYPDIQQEKGLSLIDPDTLNIEKFSLMKTLPSSISLNNKKIYVVDEMAGVLQIFDLETKKSIDSISLGNFPTNVLILNLNK